ncbi:MAG: hypothetical protein NTY99_01970 [DPANN group archaeon]|nr:hypothetical protein [DPANN group archaeon]
MAYDQLIGFILTLAATFLGVLVAFKLNALQLKVTDTQQANRLLTLLQNEIKHNKSLLNQLKDELLTHTVPFYDLRFSVWDSIPSKLASIVENPELLNETAKFYFELQHLERKINKQFELAYGISIALTGGRELREQIVRSILAHIDQILTGTQNYRSPEDLVNLIEEEKLRLTNQN